MFCPEHSEAFTFLYHITNANRIYKSKYNDGAEDKKSPKKSSSDTQRTGRGRTSIDTQAGKEKKPRDKSRTRTFFGRSKSGVV